MIDDKHHKKKEVMARLRKMNDEQLQKELDQLNLIIMRGRGEAAREGHEVRNLKAYLRAKKDKARVGSILTVRRQQRVGGRHE